MRASYRPLLAARRQPLQPELADRLQHPVARLLRLRAADLLHDALLDQRRDAVERIEPAVAHAGDRFGPRQVEAADEDGQAAKERLLGRVEQVVAPGDGVAHRPQPVRQVAGAAGQQRQGPLQPRQQRRRRQDGDAGGRQLDRQRQPVQPGEIAPTAAWFAAVRAKAGLAARARATNNWTAAGAGKGWTGTSCSTDTRSTTRRWPGPSAAGSA